MILKRKIDLLLAKSNGAQLMWLLGLSVALTVSTSNWPVAPALRWYCSTSMVA